MADNWIDHTADGTASTIPIDETVLDESIVVLLQGVNNFGDAIYSYIQLTLRSYRAMLEKMRSSTTFMPSEFGTVVAAGRGIPPADVQEEIQTTYGKMFMPTPVAQTVPNIPHPPKAWDEN